MTQTKFFRWTLLLCLSGATSPLAAQGVGEKAKSIDQGVDIELRLLL